jgi:hypothetical protein
VSGTAILAERDAALTLAAERKETARRAFCDRLSALAPLWISSNKALRVYEAAPSAAHHTAYGVVWQALAAAEPETERLLALRTEAIAAHSTAWATVDAIRRLRVAGAEVAALGYDPRVLLA